MRFKGIGKKIGDMAYKLTVSGCSCGGECRKYGFCQNHLLPMTLNEKLSYEKLNSGEGAKFGDEGINFKRGRNK